MSFGHCRRNYRFQSGLLPLACFGWVGIHDGQNHEIRKCRYKLQIQTPVGGNCSWKGIEDTGHHKSSRIDIIWDRIRREISDPSGKCRNGCSIQPVTISPSGYADRGTPETPYSSTGFIGGQNDLIYRDGDAITNQLTGSARIRIVLSCFTNPTPGT